jgi:hypothetical protein
MGKPKAIPDTELDIISSLLRNTTYAQQLSAKPIKSLLEFEIHEVNPVKDFSL